MREVPRPRKAVAGAGAGMGAATLPGCGRTAGALGEGGADTGAAAASPAGIDPWCRARRRSARSSS